MANKYPLVANSATLTIEELKSNDTLLVDNLNSTGNLTVAGLSNLGSVSNVAILGGSTGQVLSTDGNGNLSFITVSVSPSSISNGNSNVSIASAAGNVEIGVNGTANVVNISNTTVLVAGNIMPASNVTYNLGNATNRWNNLYLAGNTIDLGGAVIQASANAIVFTNPEGGSFTVEGNANVDTSKIANGSSSVAVLENGNILLSVNGNANVVTVAESNVTLKGNLVPSANNTQSLGTASMMWKDVYIGPGSLYVNGVKVLEEVSNTIVVTADTDQSVKLSTSGTGVIQLNPTGTGVIAVQGPLQIEAGENITSSDGNAINFSAPIATDSISSKTANTTLTLSGNGSGYVQINDDVTITGNLTVNGGGGNLSVTSLSIQDNIIDLSAEQTGTPTANSGIRVVRGDEAAVQLRWTEPALQWQFTNDGTNYQQIVGTYSNGYTSLGNSAVANYVTGTLTTNAQPNITSVGTLTSLAVNGNLSAGNVNAGNLLTANYVTGTLTTNAQPNITSVGTLTSLGASGDITGANLTANTKVVTDAINNKSGNLVITSNANIVFSTTGIVDIGNVRVANVGTPTNDADAATKAYVDNLVSSGIHYHQPVRVESPTALNATYNNGTAGVGATLTNAGSNVALSIDGVSLNVADRVLVYQQANAVHNGVYVVSTVGNASTAWVLTRASDADTYQPSTDNGLDEGSYFFVQEGVTGAGESYVCSTVGTITFGTTAINFAQFSKAPIYTAGTGLSLSTEQFSIANTAVTAGSYGNSDTVATFTVNNQGQLTAASNVAITANAANLIGTTLASSIVNSSLTSVGTLGSLTVTGNIGAGNVNGGNTVTANYFVGNLYGTANLAVSATTAGTVTTAAQPNITSVGTLSSLSVTGNANVGNIGAATGVFTSVQGTLTTAAQPNITSLGTLTSLEVTGNVSAGNVSGTLLTGTLTTAAQPNVTSLGTLSTLSVTGNVSAGNVSGTLLTGTLTTAAQPNVTSLGTLSSLTVNGTSNLGAVGNVTITGGSNGQVLSTNGSGALSWISISSSSISNGTSNVNIASSGSNVTIGVGGTANVGIFKSTGANITGTLDVSGNITGANLTTAGTMTAATVTETSSITLKENLRPLSEFNPLDAILQLAGQLYDRKDGSQKDEAGLIAEQVYEVIPNLVGLDKDGNPSDVRYTRLTVYLLESIKALKEEIDVLKSGK